MRASRLWNRELVSGCTLPPDNGVARAKTGRGEGPGQRVEKMFYHFRHARNGLLAMAMGVEAVVFWIALVAFISSSIR